MIQTFNDHFFYRVHYPNEDGDALIILKRWDNRIQRSFMMSSCTCFYQDHHIELFAHSPLDNEAKYHFRYVTGIPRELFNKLLKQ